MPVHSPNSLISSKNLVSTSNNEALTPSPPPWESSHNGYTPEHFSGAKWATGSQFTLPSTHSDTIGSLPSDIHTAIHTLYNEIYGEGSQQCLVTQSSLSLIITHVVQHASKHHQVSHNLSVMHSWLIFFPVNTLQILTRVRISYFSCYFSCWQQEKSHVPCVTWCLPQSQVFMFVCSQIWLAHCLWCWKMDITPWCYHSGGHPSLYKVGHCLEEGSSIGPHREFYIQGKFTIAW